MKRYKPFKLKVCDDDGWGNVRYTLAPISEAHFETEGLAAIFAFEKGLETESFTVLSIWVDF